MSSLDHFYDTLIAFLYNFWSHLFLVQKEQHYEHSEHFYFWPNNSIKQANNIITGWCWTQISSSKGWSFATNDSGVFEGFYCIPGEAEGHCGAEECWARLGQMESGGDL